MSNQNNLVIISASPRISDQSTSAFIASLAEKKLTNEGINIHQINVRKSLKSDIQADFIKMASADALIFIFPLYFFCVPGMLMRFLQDYAAYQKDHPSIVKQRVYAIVNCGFPEPEINMEAIRVMESFSCHIGASFGFGVMLSCGGMLMGTKDAPFMKGVMAGLDDTFACMAEGAGSDCVTLAPKFPHRLYFMAGNMGWSQMARENGLKKKDLYRKPYAQ